MIENLIVNLIDRLVFFFFFFFFFFVMKNEFV